MKKFILITLSLLLCLSTLVACQDEGSDNVDNVVKDDNTGTDNNEDIGNGVEVNGEIIDSEQYLNYSQTSEPSILDVARFTIVDDRECFRNILEPITRIKDGIVIPAGAESWDISEDGTIYTFHLRENYWSDGKRVTAEDYVGAIKRQADANNAFIFADDMSVIKNFAKINAGELSMEEIGAKVVDENTFTLELEQNTPNFLSAIEFFPQRQDLVDEYGDTYGVDMGSILSCGPFVLDEWVNGSKLEYVKNDNYWNQENIYLSKFTVSIFSEATTQLASFENGSIDYLNVADADYIEQFKQNTDMVHEVLSSARTVMFIMNCQDELFENEKVRLAFSLSMDRDAICYDLGNGSSTPAYGLVPFDCSVGSLNYRENSVEPLLEMQDKYADPKALLIEGMKELNIGDDPSTLTIDLGFGSTSASTRESGEFYQQMWQETLGVTINLVFNDGTIHSSNMREGEFQISMTSWGSDIEPLFQLSRWQSGGQSHWINEDYVALVNEGKVTLNDEERLNKYSEAEKLLIQSAAIAPVNYRGSVRFSYDYVRGLSSNPFDQMGMQTVYIVGR